MMNILANDGLSKKAVELFEEKNITVFTKKINQEHLAEFINSNKISVLIVRSATLVTKELIDLCPSLKIVARGGIGMDNIEVDYLKSKGVEVINTPLSSVRSVAEVVFAHIMAISRNIHLSNREMIKENIKFKELKKKFSAGIELKGKTLGIVGIGNIGKEVAKIGLGLEMNLLVYDIIKAEEVEIELNIANNKINISLPIIKDLNILISKSDFISIHTPKLSKPLMGRNELKKIKKNAIIVNTSRGGIIDEVELAKALDEGLIFGAGLDVFNDEMGKISTDILNNPKISLSPHIAGSTVDSQNRIGLELFEKIIAKINI